MGRRTVTTTGFEAFLCYLTFASVRRVVTTTKQQIKNIISGDGATVCLFMPRHVTWVAGEYRYEYIVDASQQYINVISGAKHVTATERHDPIDAATEHRRGAAAWRSHSGGCRAPAERSVETRGEAHVSDAQRSHEDVEGLGGGIAHDYIAAAHKSDAKPYM